jgi:flagellar biosynthesis protein FlhG
MMDDRARACGHEGASMRGPGPQVITVASGKGGVGKSCVVANLGVYFARQGLRVLLVDGDFGLANLDIMLGVTGGSSSERADAATLEEVLSGEAQMQEVIIGIEPNLWLLPSSSGLLSGRKLGSGSKDRLLSLLETCPWEMDVILLDAGAGISDSVLSLHSPAHHSLVVLTPEPTSLADAYGLIKLLRRDSHVSRFGIVVNQVTDGREAQGVYQKLKDIAARFLDVQLEYMGHVNRDEKIIRSVMKRKTLLDFDREAPAAKCLELLGKRIMSGRLDCTEAETKAGLSRFQDETANAAPGNTAGFWRTLFGEVRV